VPHDFAILTSIVKRNLRPTFHVEFPTQVRELIGLEKVVEVLISKEKCWNAVPEQRPTPTEVLEEIKKLELLLFK
jgi:hypothetical protein